VGSLSVGSLYTAVLALPRPNLLIRAYDSLEDRRQSQDQFYGSDEWRQGPREPILALIESFTSVVLEMEESALRGLRR